MCLEQVGEAGPAGGLIRRADVIPGVHGDQGEAMILAEDHLQAVRQSIFLELELDRRRLHARRLGRRHGRCYHGRGQDESDGERGPITGPGTTKA
jgi:hypothetical protein